MVREGVEVTEEVVEGEVGTGAAAAMIKSSTIFVHQQSLDQ